MSNFKIGFTSKKAKPLFENKPKYVNIEYPGQPNVEVDSEVELTELQKKFRENAKKEKELKEKNTSSEFWSCIVFETQEQRDAFYSLLGMNEADNQYINGKKLIKALGLKIETDQLTAPGKFKVNKDIVSLSMKPDFLT